MQNPTRTHARNRAALALGVLLSASGTPLFAQSSFFVDNSNNTAGYGNISGVNWIGSNWNSLAGGTGANVAWTNVASPASNHAIIDLTNTTSAAPTVNLNNDVSVGNITVQNYNTAAVNAVAITTTSAATYSRTLTFAAGSTVTVNDNPNSTDDFMIRAFNAQDASTVTLNLSGGFTKTGAGRLNLNANAGSGTAGNTATAVLNLGSGTFNVNQGDVFLGLSWSTSTANTRTVIANNSTFMLGTGTNLAFNTPLSFTGAARPATGTVPLGVVGGTGTVRGDGPSGSAYTISVTGVVPGTLGTVGTFNVADNATALGTNSFSFANVATSGLKFDLGAPGTLLAPGTSDVLAFSGMTSIALSSLSFSQFEFNLLPGFGSGVYRLMSGLNTTSGSLGTVTGSLDAQRTGTLSLNGSDLILTVIPEPSSFAAVAGLCAVAFAGLRRRRRAA